MARVISVAGTKGGVGKSTTAYILAGGRAELGQMVALLDAVAIHDVRDGHEVGQLPGITVASDMAEQNVGDEVAQLEDGSAEVVIIVLPGMRGMAQVFAFGLSD